MDGGQGKGFGGSASNAGEAAESLWGQAGPNPKVSRKVKMSMVIDQLDDSECLAWTPGRVRETRAAFRAQNFGIKPPKGDAPSADQFAALEHKLTGAECCFVDFGVWRPWGPGSTRPSS